MAFNETYVRHWGAVSGTISLQVSELDLRAQELGFRVEAKAFYIPESALWATGRLAQNFNPQANNCQS